MSQRGLRLLGALLIVGAAGCSLPGIHRGSSGQASPADAAADAAPIVQVRGFPRSAVVSVVAWDGDDIGFGLRASVSRTGDLVDGVRRGDHRLYMSPNFLREMGGFVRATVAPGKELRAAAGQRDAYACFYGKRCSPMVTIGVRMPDSLLRANRDSLVVTFFPSVNPPWTLTLRKELIAAYLNKVDSVVADMKKNGTT